MHCCCSGKHQWLDENHAKLCCNPSYEVVRDTTRAGLAGAECVRPIAQGLMFSGWRKINEAASNAG